MDLYVKHLAYALENVDNHYLSYRTISEFTDFQRGDNFISTYINSQLSFYEQSLERVFCYELYHQWSSLIRSQKGHYRDLVLNGEIGKTHLEEVFLNYKKNKASALIKEIQEKNLLNQKYLYPDFTLHGGNNNVQNQKLIAEVKLTKNMSEKGFIIDFYRLALYQHLYEFENVVFILLNCNIKQLLSLLKTINPEVVTAEKFVFMLRNKENTYSFPLNDLQ